MTLTLTEYQALVAAGMTEAQFLEQVRDAARTLRLRAYHTHDSRRSDPGFPDLVIVGPAGILYRELKTQNGRLRPAQADWIADLTRAGQDAAVWRPVDLLNGTVLDQLRGLTTRPSESES